MILDPNNPSKEPEFVYRLQVVPLGAIVYLTSTQDTLEILIYQYMRETDSLFLDPGWKSNDGEWIKIPNPSLKDACRAAWEKASRAIEKGLGQ